MILVICSVFDSKAGVYGTPFFSQNKAIAVRSFKRLVNDHDAMVYSAPEDFSLFDLGQFDDTSGAIHIHPQPAFVSNAISLKD